MRAQVLDKSLTAYRIGDPDGAYPIFDATGSRLDPGRWNTDAEAVIYTSEHYSTAMLEKLVNAAGIMPPNQHFISITIDAGVTYEVFSEAHYPGWAADTMLTKLYGAAWVAEQRSAVLVVPSVVARMERNLLINPAHPDIAGIRHGLHQPVWWDERLFA